MSALKLPPGFDSTDPDIYAKRLPDTEFAELRRTAPIWWNHQPDGVGGFRDGGYWLVTKHRHIREVSRRNDVFSSAANCIMPRYANEETARFHIEAGRFSMINMDGPQHDRLRAIVARAFTPRAVERLREDLDRRAHRIAEAAAASGSGDFVVQVAAELPLQAIASLLGAPEEDRMKLFQWSNEAVGDEDPEFAQSQPLAAAAKLVSYGMELAARKAGAPGDDIVAKLVEAKAGDGGLSDEEFGLFMVTLIIAGNETTRNSISQGMMAFVDHPEQWELFKRERPETAADEIIRWATPITAMQRTAVEDVELGGVQVKKGQRLVMSYRSGNFDEDVFDRAFDFDILRDPNPHLSFGGTGAHYCIGTNLARMTVGLMFGAIADHMPDLSSLGPPQRLRSGWFSGIKHWPVDYRGGRSVRR